MQSEKQCTLLVITINGFVPGHALGHNDVRFSCTGTPCTVYTISSSA